MQQALLDGAFFPIADDDASSLAVALRQLAGPYELWELDEGDADGVAVKIANLLHATAFPSSFERPCGEALHLFRLYNEVTERITSAFRMVTSFSSPGWPQVEELAVAPFTSHQELSRWRNADGEELVAAFLYENCD